MTLEEAKIRTLHLMHHKGVIVTSDGSIYLDTPVELVEKHAKENKLKIFIIKAL